LEYQALEGIRRNTAHTASESLCENRLSSLPETLTLQSTCAKREISSEDLTQKTR